MTKFRKMTLSMVYRGVPRIGQVCRSWPITKKPEIRVKIQLK